MAGTTRPAEYSGGYPASMVAYSLDRDRKQKVLWNTTVYETPRH